MGKNPPAKAGTPSIPGPWKFHVPRSNEAREAQLLSTLAVTAEAHVPRACAPEQRSPRKEKPTPRD